MLPRLNGAGVRDDVKKEKKRRRGRRVRRARSYTLSSSGAGSRRSAATSARFQLPIHDSDQDEEQEVVALPNTSRTRKSSWLSTQRREPRFLRDLQAWLARELEATGLSEDDEPSEARLVVYRQCLGAFAREFPAYQELLGKVQAEYDGVLRRYEREVGDVRQLEARLATAEKQAAVTVRQAKRSCRAALAKEKAKREELRARVRQLEEADERLRRELEQAREDAARARADAREQARMNGVLTRALQEYRDALNRRDG